MERENLTKKSIPDKPGVYFFLGKRKEILYIGKATSLQSRIRSYFSDDITEKRSPLIYKMVEEAVHVEWTVTDSVLEALLLETNLIRTHKPRFNTHSKDDKSYNHFVITNEEFPRVFIVREKDLTSDYLEHEIKYSFGPYPSGLEFKTVLKIISRLFKYYDTKDPVGSEKTKFAKGRVDFNRQIGLYPEKVTKKEYNKTIRHIRLFFEGKKKQIIRELTKEMNNLAKNEEFEKADLIKKKIFALKHIQDVALLKRKNIAYRDERSIRFEAYDVAHFGGKEMVGVMTAIVGSEPKKSEYRKFKIRSVSSSNDPAALGEILKRRLLHEEWPYPQIIVADGGKAQKNALERVLKSQNLLIPVVAVTKDQYHRPSKILGERTIIEKHHDTLLLANQEAHRFALRYHQSKRKVA